MDEIDHIGEEELKLAAQFAAHLEGDNGSALPKLAKPIALLQNSARWELSPQARKQGRAEVEKWARDASPESTTPHKSEKPASTFRWFYWLPLPGVAIAALSLVLFRPVPESGEASLQQEASRLSLESEEDRLQAEQAVGARASPMGDGSDDELAADSEAGFTKVEPRFHVGQVRPALIQAQTAVLLERSPGVAKEKARQKFELEMRAYRGQLIASLEAGGR